MLILTFNKEKVRLELPFLTVGVKNMKRFSVITIVCLVSYLAAPVSLFASGSGHHSHGHDESAVSSGENITHKETRDGVDAYLEFSKPEKRTETPSGDFFSKCLVKASLKDSKTGKSLKPTRLVLRATKGHDQFGEAVVFSVNDDNVMQASLFVKEQGEHHYLLIADIEDVGVKEFHFHHDF